MLILADTSIWIEIFKSKKGQYRADDFLNLCTCMPVVQEVLQGVRDANAFSKLKESLMALPRFADPLPSSTFLHAAEIYRLMRRQSFTIRSSIDCLIAAIAIENNVPVWHKDRDFDFISRGTSLQIVNGIK